MGKGDNSRGATLVEAALVFPILILMIIGIMEIGLAFKDYLTVSYISREGARVGAIAGNQEDADCAILRGIGTVANSKDLARIEEIQIFKVNPDGSQNFAKTNVAHFVPGNDPDDCSVPSAAGDGWQFDSVGWNPTSRQTVVGRTSTSPELDLLGVRVILTRSWVTGFPPFRGTFDIDEETITRLEPRAFEE